jgi:hypothetical protein
VADIDMLSQPESITEFQIAIFPLAFECSDGVLVGRDFDDGWDCRIWLSVFTVRFVWKGDRRSVKHIKADMMAGMSISVMAG